MGEIPNESSETFPRSRFARMWLMLTGPTGEYEVTSDEKGRISIPGKLKEEISGQTMIMTKGIGMPYLSVYVKEVFDYMIDVLYSSSANALNYGISALQRVLIAPSVRFEVDKAGRFLIPPTLRSYAGITPRSSLVVLGLLNRLEIWEKERYAQYCSDSQSSTIEQAQELFSGLSRKGLL